MRDTRRGPASRPAAAGRARGRGGARPAVRGTPRAESSPRPRPSRAERPQPPRRTSAAPSPRASLTGRAAVLALVLGVLAVSYAYPLRAWWEQHSRIAELEAEQHVLADGVAALEAERDRWEDPAFVRAQARERLGYVVPGEIGFVVVDSAPPEPEEQLVGGDPGEPGEAVAAVEAQGSWWSRLAASVQAADAVPEEPAPEPVADPATEPEGVAPGAPPADGEVPPEPAP